MRTVRRAISLLILCLLVGSTALAEQFNLTKTVSGTVNGQSVSASATGIGHPGTGEYTLDWTFTSVPMNFSVYGSIVTKAGSIGAAVARTSPGAVNLLELSGGNYTIREVARFPGNEVIVTDVTVSRSGNTITSTSVMNGTATLPPLSGIRVPGASWVPVPASNKFVERVTKSLLPQGGGSPILVDTETTFTLGSGSLPYAQTRNQTLTVLQATPDAVNPTSARIQYTSALTENVIPTLSEWGLVVLIALFVAAGTWMVLRRRDLTRHNATA